MSDGNNAQHAMSIVAQTCLNQQASMFNRVVGHRRRYLL